MTIRELEEQSGECIELDAPYAGLRDETLKLIVWQEHVWVMRQDRSGMWESLRPATVHDTRTAADADRRIA